MMYARDKIKDQMQRDEAYRNKIRQLIAHVPKPLNARSTHRDVPCDSCDKLAAPAIAGGGKVDNCGRSVHSAYPKAKTTHAQAKTELVRRMHRPTTATTLLFILLGKRSVRANGGTMKFTCRTKDIAAAVGAASKVVNAHTTVPILSNVLFKPTAARSRSARPISS